MAIYRFKIYWEENSDVERIILIKPNQTFFDFYKIITESFELNNQNASASFFTSDDYWDKHLEITLKKEDIQQDEKLMIETTIVSMVEYPKQKFVFVYDATLQLTFHIELIKIEKENNQNETELPKVILSKNKIPNRRKSLHSSKTEHQSDSAIIPNLNDDELDKIICANLMNKNINEEDILNGNIDALLSDNQTSDSKNTDEENDELDDEEENLFDEDNDVFDDDDFNDDDFNDEYFDSNDNYEN